MNRNWIPLAALVLLAGCADAFAPREKAGGKDRPELLYAAHLKPPAAGPAARKKADPALMIIRNRIAEARAKWNAELAGEAGRFPFFDFSAPALGNRRKKLKEKGYEKVFQQSFTAEDALVAAYLHNPGLAAVKRAWQAKIDRLDEVTRLDAVVREYSAFSRDMRLKAGKPVGRDMTGKAFPAPGMLELMGKAVEKEIGIARENYRIKARDLVRDVRHAVADLAYVDRALEVTGEVLSLMQAFEEVVRVRYEGGEARQSSLLRAQVEVAQLENKLLTLQEKRAVTGARLASLLGMDGGGKMARPKRSALPALPPDVEAVQTRALEKKQEIARQGLKVERMETLLELAETKSFPTHTLGLSYFERAMGTKEGGGRRMPPFRAKPKVDPKAWYAVTQAHLDEVKDLLEGARKKLADLEFTTRFAVQRAWSGLDTALRLEALYRTSLTAKANQAYEAALAGYRVGRAGFNDVTDARRMLLRFRLDEAAARRDALKAAASLVREIGSLPE
jgi:outer membrane protein TolC